MDLKLEPQEKENVARGAAIDAVASFVRAAAQKKALRLIAQELPVTFSPLDCVALIAAINRPIAPNPAMEKKQLALLNELGVLESSYPNRAAITGARWENLN